ncbi:MAG: ATP-binding protein, partial [Polyangiaceae bacterium]
ERIAAAHRQAPIAWLTGVRRIGKTTLVREFPGLYLDCDLPSVAERVHDPERFLASLDTKYLLLDEVHQLADPSRLLKIAADNHPKLRVIATGSSTLAATTKFRDSLTGRKRTVHLLPVLAEELASFGVRDLDRRLLHGGLPPALLAEAPPSDFYSEWMDSFYARDVQELFRVEKRTGFLQMLETLLRQSGGLLEVTSIARATSLSRPTVMNYLEVLQVTHAITLLRPFHGGGKQELTHQPKAYGFDTGFVAWAHGWNELHAEDRGNLWEHVVLETLMSLPGDRRIHYWRDKQQREVDFVIPTGRGACDAYECKWNARAFDPRGLKALRASHPRGRNFLVAPIAGEPQKREIGGMNVTVMHPAQMRAAL